MLPFSHYTLCVHCLLAVDCSILHAVFKHTSNNCVWLCKARQEML